MKKLLICLSFLLFTFSFSLLKAQNTWLQQANMGGGQRDEAGGFSIGKYGYILAGTNDTGEYLVDLWRWNSDSNTWLRMDSFPGGQRIGVTTASLGGYGYVIGGEKPSSCFIAVKRTHGGVCAGTFYGDVWRYNPDSNTWLSLASCPGNARNLAVAVADSDNNTIYFGSGNDNDSTYMQDWWGYNVLTNTWTQLANFGGGQRCEAVGFYLNGNIYVGTGNDMDSLHNGANDFWQYNPATNIWTKVAYYPGGFVRDASAFELGDYGYVCLGIDDTTYSCGGYRYNPVNNSWLPITNFSGYIMADAVGFSINGNGFLCTGAHDANAYSQFWEYTPDAALAINQLSAVSNHPDRELVYPNPSNGLVSFQSSVVSGHPDSYRESVEVYNVLGETVYSANYQPIANGYQLKTIDLSSNPSGVYFYQILNSGKTVSSGKLVIVH